MKKYFFTGLAILLPLVLTILIAQFVINFLTDPFAGWVRSLITQGTGPLNNPQIVETTSRILALILFFAFVIAIGLLGRWVFFRAVIRAAESLFHRIPFVNKVYQACKDVVQNLFYSDKKSFQTVVLIPYPNPDILSIGLVTQDAILKSQEGDQTFISVFVPATPNPTMGFILLFEKEKVIFTEMSVRRALQLLISCGSKLDDF